MSPVRARCTFLLSPLVSETYPDVLNLIQLDQAPAHTSRKLKIPDNIVLLYQPPHSPEVTYPSFLPTRRSLHSNRTMALQDFGYSFHRLGNPYRLHELCL
ncbi:hypothetical protein ACFE35_23805, partial [Phormidesmis priestleyi ANT.L61.2]